MGTIRGERTLLVGIWVLSMLVVSAVPVLAWNWQATYYPLGHSASFNTTLSGGQEDAAVEYDTPGERHAWGEGAYLTWTQSAINQMVADFYCANNYCDPKVWYETASVLHAFDKSADTFNALRSYGWAWSNLPGVYASSHYDGGEYRFYIEAPTSMSAGTSYYSQVMYRDTAYDGSTKTNGRILLDTYKAMMGGVPPEYTTNRDNHAKLCINNDNASTPNGQGNCP